LDRILEREENKDKGRGKEDKGRENESNRGR
jgi:hypothetical protein